MPRHLGSRSRAGSSCSEAAAASHAHGGVLQRPPPSGAPFASSAIAAVVVRRGSWLALGQPNERTAFSSFASSEARSRPTATTVRRSGLNSARAASRTSATRDARELLVPRLRGARDVGERGQPIEAGGRLGVVEHRLHRPEVAVPRLGELVLASGRASASSRSSAKISRDHRGRAVVLRRPRRCRRPRRPRRPRTSPRRRSRGPGDRRSARTAASTCRRRGRGAASPRRARADRARSRPGTRSADRSGSTGSR